MKQENAVFDQVLNSSSEAFVADWIAEISASGGMAGATTQNDARELLEALRSAVAADADLGRMDDASWAKTRGVLTALSASRAAQGASAGDTSQFVMALKRPLFVGLQKQLAADPKAAFDAAWTASRLVDRLAQFTATTYQRTREEVINRQQQEL